MHHSKDTLADKVEIRAAVESDAAVMHALLTELAEATRVRDKLISSADDLRRHGFSEAPKYEALLAEQDGEIVGMTLFFYTFSSWRGAPGVYVQDIVVRKSARGRGIGRRLLLETAKQAGRQGATHLRLAVEHDNADAARFYDRLGLKPCDSERMFEADGAAFERLVSAA